MDTIIGPFVVLLIEMDSMLPFNNMFELFHNIVRISIFMLAEDGFIEEILYAV